MLTLATRRKDPADNNSVAPSNHRESEAEVGSPGSGGMAVEKSAEDDAVLGGDIPWRTLC